MRFLKENNLSPLSLIASCIIHLLLFVFIFILIMRPNINHFSLPTNRQSYPIIFHQPTYTPQKHTITPKEEKESPIPESAKKTKDQFPEAPTQETLKKDEEVAQAELPGSLSTIPKERQSLSKKTIKKAESISKPFTTTTEQENQQEKKTDDTKKESLQKPLTSLSTILESTDAPALFTLPKPTPEVSNSTAEQTTAYRQLRKNKLTLADLFKDLSSPLGFPDSIDNNSQDGELNANMLVINQGDMKYYSFLEKFITHINQVFSFHNGPNQARQWAQQGLLKNNTNLTIIIDKKGNVLAAEILQSSGYAPFDKLSLKTIYLASPFPPIPDRLGHQKIRVNLSSYL